jgi:peptidoglycan/xylan/chitin deacetylase (PgdA/CDA1 family)
VTRTARRIAVVPAYNEQPTVAAVLDELYPLVDELVVVDDGSTDNTRCEIERWMAGKARCHLLVHAVNQGMSEAYYTALTELRERLRVGELDADDLVFTVDADGQHDLHVLNELVQMTIDEGLDANLARRDLSYHGPFKRTGNWLLSKWASLWAWSPLHDVESGYRIFRLGALAHALDYYSGYKYSETVEVAVVLCQLGYNVRNDHVVPVPVARSRTRMRDALIDMTVIPIAAGRVWHRDRIREALATDAMAHVAIAGILGLLCSFTYVHATDTMLTLILAAIAAFGLGSVIRRFVPRPSLSLLGALLALVAAWLVPQRPDMGSAITLAALFGVGASLAAPPVRRPRPLVLVGAFVVFVVVRIGGTRATLLGLAVIGVGIAALAARFGRVAMPGTYRMRTLAVGSVLVLATSGITGYFGASTVGATWFGGGVTHGPRSADTVAITFDDGPNVHATPAIMKILDDAGVKGTFFIVGKALDSQPQIVRDLYADGHLVGNHSYHHDDWRWLDPRYPELARTQDAFARRVGTCPVWFRPPHGQKTPMMARVVHEHGMQIALWDVSVGDWATNDPNVVADKVLERVRGGSIIDLHDGFDGKPWVDRSVVVKALPKILDGLREKHLRPVRLDQLVGGPAYQPCTKQDT